MVEHVNTVDEGTAIGKVAVMHASCDAVLGNPVRLALERPASMNQQVHLLFLQEIAEARPLGVCA
ncbi:hypothetical protein D3C76_1529230 [compost metagenome]